MKLNLLSLSLALLLILTSCGPPAESRESMQSRAKVVADSIANLIKSSMAEAETPGPAPVAKTDTSSAVSPTNTPVK